MKVHYIPVLQVLFPQCALHHACIGLECFTAVTPSMDSASNVAGNAEVCIESDIKCCTL